MIVRLSELLVVQPTTSKSQGKMKIRLHLSQRFCIDVAKHFKLSRKYLQCCAIATELSLARCVEHHLRCAAFETAALV